MSEPAASFAGSRPQGRARRLPGGWRRWVAVICCLVVATAVTLAVISYNSPLSRLSRQVESWADGQDTVLEATTQLYPEWPELLPERLVVEAEIRPDATAAEVCELADQLNGLFDPEAGDDIRRDLSLRLTRSGTSIVYEDQLFWPRSSVGRDWEAPHCAPLEYAYDLAGPGVEEIVAGPDSLRITRADADAVPTGLVVRAPADAGTRATATDDVRVRGWQVEVRADSDKTVPTEVLGPVMEALPANDDGLIWLDSQGDSAIVRPADSVVSLTARRLEDQPGGPTVEEQAAAVLAAAEGTPGLEVVGICASKWLADTAEDPESTGSCVYFDLDTDGAIVPDTPYPHGLADPDALYAAAQELRS
ncbi:MAG: hypothetical protein I3J03_01890 [Actinomyces succiniciruminis]|nr:hypothetical protein [Actinomyces succiniciruminis]